MNNPKPLNRLVLALAGLALASAAQAQTTLKFSHTDQQAGARQAAASLFEIGRASCRERV